MAGEFSLISRYFDWPANASGVDLSVGDDAALLSFSPNHQLALSVDTLVPGVHFPFETSPVDVGYKALAVNVSDMAAMGAKPHSFTLALTLSSYDDDWLNAFSSGLREAAGEYGVDLIGGDTTRGSQTITIQILGQVDKNTALTRAAAHVGDVLYVTNTLGDAAAGLLIQQSMQVKKPQANQLTSQRLSDAQQFCLSRLNRPTARVPESCVIRQYANACMDVSDGLLQDLSHILNASSVGATLNTDCLPISEALSTLYSSPQCQAFALSGGDDYELLFTVPADYCEAFEADMKAQALSCQAIGLINAEKSVIRDQNGHVMSAKGFQHF